MSAFRPSKSFRAGANPFDGGKRQYKRQTGQVLSRDGYTSGTMNLRGRYHRSQRIAWVQALLALLLITSRFTVGEWHCEDGRSCAECNLFVAQNRHIEECDCPGSQEEHFTSDCHACCSYVAFDAPTVYGHPAVSSFPRAILLPPPPFVQVAVFSSSAVLLPAYRASLPPIHAPPLPLSRAPPFLA